MIDNSFLKLYKNDFSKAVLNDNINVNATRYGGFVQMLPNDIFLQITNCKQDIAFGNNIAVDLIDECQNFIKSLTVNENFFYTEFTDIFGIKQIAFAFGNIGEDFGDGLLFLRLKHTVSDNVWYSAGFSITDNLKEETTLFIYKSEAYFRGISYDKQNVFQRIRLACFKTDIDPQTESEELTQISGNRYGLRPITTLIDKYLFYCCDFFTYSRILQVLSHPIVYIDSFRANTKAADLSKSERIVDSNFFDANFDTNPTEEEYSFGYQIYQNFDCVGKMPTGNYTLANYNTATATSTLFTLAFNKPFTIASDISAKLYKNGTLFATFNASKFAISGQNLNIDVSASPVTDIADYSIVIEPNKVNHNSEYWNGFAYNEWHFSIITTPIHVGFYNPTSYNPTYYNT